MEIKDSVIIVTGGAGGIGRAVSELFVKEGGIVVISSRNEKELLKTAEELSSFSGKCIPVKCDVSNSKEVKSLVKEVMERFSHIDILVNGAGVGYYKSLLKTTEDEWDRTINVNLKGPFLLCKEALPYMKKGVIVNISSGAGKHGHPGFSAYCASKFGLVGFSESIAGEFPHIKVYSLCPGPVKTKMLESTLEVLREDNVDTALFLEANAKSPDFIASHVLKLCKEEYLPSGSSIEPY